MLPLGWAFMAQKVCSGLFFGGGGGGAGRGGGTKEVGVRCLDFVFVIVDRIAQLHNWGENKGHCSRDYALKK